jgi:hypothetical protein
MRKKPLYRKPMGRPPGIPSKGTYGEGIETVVVRVPVSWKEKTPKLIIDLPKLIKEWKSKATNQPRWDKCNKLIAEIEELLEFEE